MPSLASKLRSSLAVIGAAAALPLFALHGSFTQAEDPFPHSVEVGPVQK